MRSGCVVSRLDLSTARRASSSRHFRAIAKWGEAEPDRPRCGWTIRSLGQSCCNRDASPPRTRKLVTGKVRREPCSSQVSSLFSPSSQMQAKDRDSTARRRASQQAVPGAQGICANLGRNADWKPRRQGNSLIGCPTRKSLASAKNCFFMQVPKGGWVIHRRRGSGIRRFLLVHHLDSLLLPLPIACCLEKLNVVRQPETLNFLLLYFFDWAASHFLLAARLWQGKSDVEKSRCWPPETDDDHYQNHHHPQPPTQKLGTNGTRHGKGRAPALSHSKQQTMRRRKEEDPCSQIALARTRSRQPI